MLINIHSVSTKPEVGCSVRRWFSSCLNITQHHLKHTAGVVSSLRWECVVLSRCLCSWRELKPHTHPDHEKLARTICFRYFRTKCAPQDAAACKQLRMIYFVKHSFFFPPASWKWEKMSFDILLFDDHQRAYAWHPSNRPAANGNCEWASTESTGSPALRHLPAGLSLCSLLFLGAFSNCKTLRK